MANKQDFGGLSSAMDLSKLPLYGVGEEQIQNLRNSQEKIITALEQRYSQPNYFKVAAGFAKPQLGGFLASLGSASEAMGDTVEQERAQQLPIAMMRSQLAQSEVLLGQNKTVSAMLADRRAKNLPITPEFVSEVTARFPDSPVAKALAAEITTQQKQQDILSGQQRLILDAIQLKQSKGMPLSPQEKSFLENLPSQLSGRTEATPLLADGKPIAPPAGQPAGATTTAVKPASIEGTPLNPIDGNIQKAEPQDGPKTGKFYAESFPVPNLAEKADWERSARGTAWANNAKAEEDRNLALVNSFATQAADPIYTKMKSHYDQAISMIENNPALAKRTFNIMRGQGDLQNQIMVALQEGAGLNIGNISTQINLPIKAFRVAGFTPDEQKFADTLVHSMLVLGNTDLAIQGFKPEKGQAAYLQNLATKASLDQNAATALNILHKNSVTFDQNKKMYDTLIDERSRYVNPESLTPYTDVLRNSPKIKRIEEEAKQRLEYYKKAYQEILKNEKPGDAKPAAKPGDQSAAPPQAAVSPAAPAPAQAAGRPAAPISQEQQDRIRRFEADVRGIENEISRLPKNLPKNDDRLAILQSELARAKSDLAKAQSGGRP